MLNIQQPGISNTQFSMPSYPANPQSQSPTIPASSATAKPKDPLNPFDLF